MYRRHSRQSNLTQFKLSYTQDELKTPSMKPFSKKVKSIL